MFQFPRFPPTSLCVQLAGTQAFPWVGFPIRASPDQSLLDGSPRLIAAYRALLRPLTPRHPPSALSSLTMQSAELNLSHSVQLLRC